jgi:hypothetical protein
VIGQGSRGLGEGRRPAAEEIAALRLGLDLDLSLIDTAVSYGDGATETLVGRRDGGGRVLVIAGIAAIVIAGAWWAACIAAVGLLLAVAGLIDVVFAQLGDDPVTRAWANRRVALALGAPAVAAYVVTLGAG